MLVNLETKGFKVVYLNILENGEIDYEELINANEKFSLLKINLDTGRSHQIRVQLSEIRLPIYGDAKYGAHPKANIALYASMLRFEHPTTKQVLSFKVCPPVDKLPWKTFESSVLKVLEI